MSADTKPRMRLLHITDWPLSIKLIAGTLLVSLVPLLTSAYRNTEVSIEALRQTELKNLKQVAGNVAGRIGQLITDTRRVAAFIASESELIELLEKPGPKNVERALAQMQYLLSSNPDIDLIMVMNREGDALMSTEPSVVGKNFKFREYFVSAIQGRPFITSIIVGTGAGASGVYISNPIKDRNGLVNGIVMLRLTESAIRAIVEDVRMSKTREGFIVDSDGVVIYHPNRALMHTSLMDLPPETQKRIAQDRRFARDSIPSLKLPDLQEAVVGARESGALRYIGLSKTAQIAGYAPVRAHSWTVVINSPETEFAAPMEDLFWRNVTLVAVLAGVFIVLTFLFARYLTRPIRDLTQAARALGEGKFELAKTEIHRRDELGTLARTFNQMGEVLRDREHEREIFGRLVSPDVRDKLVKGELKLGGEQLRVTVLFSDIRGFTTISEATGPHEVVLMLNEYLTEMTEAVKPWDGYVNNFIGDAIVVIFGAPVSKDDLQWRAVNAAFAMRERLAALNERRVARGDQPIDNGIGIASGRVIAGQMGSPDRCMYTVIGDTVNIAARIESMTREFPAHPILVNDEVYQAVKDQSEIQCHPLGEHQVKGRKAAVAVYAVAPSA